MKQRIGNYRILSHLGEGGMADVYLAEYETLEVHCAMKVLKPEFLEIGSIKKRFLGEAKNLARMSHRNVVKVTDLIDTGDIVAFAMEYIDGQTLKEYIEQKGKLSNNEIHSVFTQMLDAVGYIHAQNLIHRDIKPSNFMTDRQGNVKLLDFGIAKNLNPTSLEYTMTQKHEIMGTVMYMSPEQVKSTKDVTHTTDIYSLGVVLWQMVKGGKPYDAEEFSIPEIQYKIIKEPLPLIDPFWDDIIQKATAKNTADRYQHAFEFSLALTELSKNIPHSTVKVNREILSDEPTRIEKITEPITVKNDQINNVVVELDQKSNELIEELRAYYNYVDLDEIKEKFIKRENIDTVDKSDVTLKKIGCFGYFILCIFSFIIALYLLNYDFNVKNNRIIQNIFAFLVGLIICYYLFLVPYQFLFVKSKKIKIINEIILKYNKYLNSL